jgi:hypothetical protein
MPDDSLFTAANSGFEKKSTTDFQSVAGGSFRTNYRFETCGSWNCFIARISVARFFQSSLAMDATPMKHGWKE